MIDTEQMVFKAKLKGLYNQYKKDNGYSFEEWLIKNKYI